MNHSEITKYSLKLYIDILSKKQLCSVILRDQKLLLQSFMKQYCVYNLMLYGEFEYLYGIDNDQLHKIDLCNKYHI